MHVTAAVLALVTVTSVPLLQALGRRLLSMAAPPPADPADLAAAFVTCPNETVAKELARAMVEKRLAACVNILPHVTSIVPTMSPGCPQRPHGVPNVPQMIKTRSSRGPGAGGVCAGRRCGDK
ncbi:protein CutA-like [Columba livia]|uniref:protein CutA-like n=1 Tax=Columba livia TaxID=8932 RepID=UPI0031BA5A9E